MAARFAVVTEEEIAKIKEDSIREKTKKATKHGLKFCKNFRYATPCYSAKQIKLLVHT